MTDPNVTKYGVLAMQICVPKTYTDEQVEEAANRLNPSGLSNGWSVRKVALSEDGSDAKRVQCESDCDNCHIILEC